MADYYKDKDVSRYTLILSETHKEKLKKVAKTYSITQGEVVEVLLDQMNLGLLGGHLEAKRKTKTSDRVSQRSVIEQLKGLTPEQLKAAEAAIAALKTGE